jgi:hypothetical protein
MFPNNRVLVALRLPTRVGDLLAVGRVIVKSMSNNPAFSNPTPALSTVNDAIAALATAELAVSTRARGAVETRNGERATLVTLLHGLKGYVQHVADSGDRAEAEAVITGASMGVSKSRARVPRRFDVRPGKLSGEVDILGKVAGPRAAYEWQASSDGGKTWQLLRVTMQAKTTMSGLTPGSIWCFRFRAVTKAGEGDWSNVVSVVVR